MKVLWFSNSPAGAEVILQTEAISGGWLGSLAEVLRDKVELTIAFYFARYALPFEAKGVKYIPICKKKWRINIIKESIFGTYIDREDLHIYKKIIAEVRPDIIHIHGTENPFGCIVGETEIPIVVSIQGNCTVVNHKFYSGIERKYASNKNSRILSPYSWLFNKSYNQVFRNLSQKVTEREKKYLKEYRYVIGRTDWDRRITRILAPQSRYFHNDEILRNIFYNNEWCYPNNKKIIIHSTINESILKGFETICQASNELNKIGKDFEWRVAGVSNNSLLDKVVRKKLKNDYPLNGMVLFGKLQPLELITKMLEADCFVMPSHIENSPNSLCEAMILGMPCITTQAGGSSSLLRDKEEGLIIQDGDPWSMAGAVLELIHEKETAISYGKKAREKSMRRHNKDIITKGLVEIYGIIKSNK